MTDHTDHPHLRHLIRTTNHRGVTFLDVLPILHSFSARRSAFALMQERVEDCKIDLIVVLETRGIPFGQGVADRLQLGFMLARKPGKLPPPVVSYTYSLEYGTDTIELAEGVIRPGQRVLVIDDILATGGTMGAACELVQSLGGHPIALVLVEIEACHGRSKLRERFPELQVESVLKY